MKKQIQIPLILFLICAVILACFYMDSYESIPVNDSSDNNTSKENVTKQLEESTNENIEKETTTVEVTTEPETTTSDTFTIKLSFIGDCLCATDVNAHYENAFNDVADVKDPSYFFQKVKKYFKKDDFTIGDCENVFSDSTDLHVSDKGQYADPNIEAYWFKSAAKNAKILKEGGVDVVSISNNHINDYGPQGHEDTKKALDDAGVEWGEEGKIVYLEKNGYKLAVICMTMYGEYYVDSIKEAIAEASENSDYQIVYFHGGTEAIHAPENWKINACHALVDAGADLIMGDHPHVLQPMETYNDVTIIYSLGNFIFGGNRHPKNRTVIYQHTLTIKKDTLESESGKLIPCYVYTGETNNWQPDIITDESQKQTVLDFMAGKIDLPY